MLVVEGRRFEGLKVEGKKEEGNLRHDLNGDWDCTSSASATSYHYWVRHEESLSNFLTYFSAYLVNYLVVVTTSVITKLHSYCCYSWYSWLNHQPDPPRSLLYKLLLSHHKLT